MINDDKTHIKGKSYLQETIRNYKVNNNDQEQEDQNEGYQQEQQQKSEDEEEVQDNQDITDVQEWREIYNQIRHELFEHNQINVLKLLALNKTTKLKHKIIMMSSEEDENNYDRSRERELIFKKIKALKVELRIYKENKRSKKVRPEQLQDQIQVLEKKFDDLKLEQMDIFNSMESEKSQIEEYLSKIDKKINNESDSGEDSDDESENDKLKRTKKENYGDDYDQKGKKKSEAIKLAKMLKQNSQVNLYEVNEVAEEYQDGNESVLTKNGGVHSFARSQPTQNKLESNSYQTNLQLLLDTDEDEEEEYREILNQVGVNYGVEDQQQDEELEIENKIKTKLKKNSSNQNNKIPPLRKNSISNKENIGREQDTNHRNTQPSQSKNSLSDFGSKVNQKETVDDSGNEDDQREQEGDDYDPDEDIMRDELNFALQQGKKQKKQNEQEQNDIKEIENQIEDMENDLQDLKLNIDKISQQMKNMGDQSLGWLKEDHQDFLRVKSKYKNEINNTKFIEECVNVIPVHDKEEIEEHIQLYLQYSALDQEKKDVLKRYKLIKDQKTQLEEELKSKKVKIQEEVLIQRKLKKTREQIMEERLKQKDKIMVWKQNKLSYKDNIVQQELEEKRILQSLDKEKRIRDDKLKEERKQLIKQYQEQKELERKKLREMEELQKEKEKVKKKVSLTEITRIKAKEEQMVRKKQIRVLEKKIQTKEESIDIQRIQSINKEKYSYIENRLLEQTKAAERRITQKFDNQGKIDRFGPSADSFAGNPLGIGGRLKVPQWRSNNV
ncbi:hypothetical protein TTHERM_00382300 (macronuclear) [Tetrahymena thermophila SB210]|uniref:Uncharacterized protein n=1 Tax=Tetrahymena thermophila (strain SB210) TaxID=312017 RepID=Q23F84_TETTS|nr:hypothetical protein TTHERM_00382300 [Tetrahymena thermophila SB210]EAR95269.1 hypothetical protein TTHERM_00382300 [Tetrahymena thermophila SB210]|eukprot:XP_001015514.1 hypothetical protein TTHERM_00382300 [Tetrahymena thermophila SB210]